MKLIIARLVDVAQSAIFRIRPRYIVETTDPLIPDVHYISVDAEFDSNYRYANHEKLSQQIAKRYLEVIKNSSILVEVAANP